MGLTHLIFLILVIFLVSGCSIIDINTSPQGAQIIELATGEVLGISPTTQFFTLDNPDSNNCEIIPGIKAVWVSGAEAEVKKIKLCE